jgi:hypothetical protein
VVLAAGLPASLSSPAWEQLQDGVRLLLP